MGNTVFVPLSDDLLYDHPEKIVGPVIPFSQQARRSAVESEKLGLTVPALDAESKLETVGETPTNPSDRDKAALPHGGALR